MNEKIYNWRAVIIKQDFIAVSSWTNLPIKINFPIQEKSFTTLVDSTENLVEIKMDTTEILSRYH